MQGVARIAYVATCSMDRIATTQTETIRGPTYSLARAMGEPYLFTDLRSVHVLQNIYSVLDQCTASLRAWVRG